MNSNAITNNTTKQLVTKKAHILTEIIRPTIVAVKNKPVIVGAVGFIIGGCAIADDIRQRKKARIILKNQKNTIEALKKHEEQIRSLQVKADKAKAWKIENEQLREEIKERNLNYEER